MAQRLSPLDEELARRTIEDLLARLSGKEAASAAALYLTDSAQAAGLDATLAGLADDSREIVEATLLELRRTTPASYEARTLLRWSGAEGPATQTMTLRLTYERGLWLIDDLSLGDVRQVAVTPAAVPRRAAATSTPQGRLVFQESSGGQIYVIHADGTGLRRVTDGLDPAWSPGGARIAFTRWRQPWGVYVVDPDGTGEERVVDGNQFKEVAWAPDGQRLAYTLNRGTSEPTEVCFFGYCFTIPAFSFAQIWVADLATGDLLSLPLDDQAVHAPTWSPSGEHIVYAGDRGLAWIDLDGMETGRFAGGSAWDGSPVYSPDGKQIAFMGRVHDRWEIFVMNADGRGRRQLTRSDPRLEEPPSNVAPAWSPDGEQIAFLSNRDDAWRIYVMNADGSRQRPMFGEQLEDIQIAYDWASERVISWGPD
jgi:TolB protein